MKHIINEKKDVVERTDVWQTEIDNCDVFISRNKFGFTELSIAPNSYKSPRLPLLKFYPKNVSDLETFSKILPDLLRKLATEMRDNDLVDLRDEVGILHDELESKINRNFKVEDK